jgi:hypothetical protein
MAEFDAEERHSIVREFKAAVNMSPAALRAWLDDPQSQSVGMTQAGETVTEPGDGEAVGHGMGRKILALRAKKASNLDADDYAAMRKVVGYVHRHIKQRPHGDVTDTRWRKSLMNWGHDPLK